MIKCLKSEGEKFLAFCNSNKLLLVFISVITIIVYFPKIFLYSYGIDTELMIDDPRFTLNWWVSLNRYGLALIKKITLFGIDINVMFINCITYLLLIVCMIFICYLFFRTRTIKSISIVYIGSFLFLTSPTIIEQNYFILQSAEVMLAFTSLIIGIFFVQLWVENKKISLLILGNLFTLFAFSVYQSLQVGFIILAIGMVYLNLKDRNYSLLDYVFSAAPYIITLLITVVLNMILSRVFMKIFHVWKSPYLKQMSIVGRVPNEKLINSIKSSLSAYFIHHNHFFFNLVTILMVLSIVIIFLNKETIISKLTMCFSVFLIFVSSVSLIFILGWYGPMRSYMPTISLALFVLSLIVLNECRFKSLFAVILVGLILFGGAQAKVSADLSMTCYTIFKKEEETALLIKENLAQHNIVNYSDYKLAVYGMRSFEDNQTARGDVIGSSMMNWDNGDIGPTNRTRAFLKIEGMEFSNVSSEEYSNLKSSVADMPIFPSKDSIKVVDNKYVIIKFNN